MFPKVEYQNEKLIIEKLLSEAELDDDEREELKNKPIEKIIYHLECANNLNDILKNLDINYIIYTKYCEGGFDFESNDFKFGLERGESDSSYFKELAKMYAILASKDNYDLYIEECI